MAQMTEVFIFNYPFFLHRRGNLSPTDPAPATGTQVASQQPIAEGAFRGSKVLSESQQHGGGGTLRAILLNS
jgi:hypothetical protein